MRNTGYHDFHLAGQAKEATAGYALNVMTQASTVGAKDTYNISQSKAPDRKA
jgi:hypothetical protein